MVQNNCTVELQRDAYVKDLGVVFDEKLNFSQHISERINKAYSVLWLIRRNFRDIGSAAFVLIYKHLVRSHHLEYNNSVWASYRKSDIDKLEKVQKRATKMIQEMGNFKYPERLRQFELPTLAHRRNRGDMIVTYKLISGLYDEQVTLQLDMATIGQHYTRGNSRKLTAMRCRFDLRKYCFTNRIVNMFTG